MNDLVSKKLDLSDHGLKLLADFLSECFPGTDKFGVEYLSWLYSKNPEGNAIGFNAFDGEKLVAHYSCIPMSAMISGKEHKGLLSLNTATDRNYQGKGLFKKLALQTYEYAKEIDYSFVCGVSNAVSTKLFNRLLKFDVISPLEVELGFGRHISKHKPAEVSALCEFYPVWSQERINWRAENPMNRCFVNVSEQKLATFRTNSHLSGIKVIGSYFEYGELNSDNEMSQEPPPRFRSHFGLNVSLSLYPDGIKKPMLYWKVPDRFKASPLNFIFKPLNSDVAKIDKGKVFFSFMDFDAY